MDMNQGKRIWNELEGRWLDPRSKLNKIQSSMATHEAVFYYPMIHWKTKKRLNYKWDVCDALMTSRPQMNVQHDSLFTISFEQME